MRIIIKENIDDFNDDYLDYNEDKYYLVNSFKEFKKYGHKDKHHQDIDAITSNYKELLKDLEKNNIFISDKFKDIKESDLDKENDYFILDFLFTNNIVEQLGYTPNTYRTYKDDIIEYEGKNISSAEFENMINDKSNEYNWLSKCKFKNAGIIIGKYGITFSNGIWINGTWKGGGFINSTWKYGIWVNGKLIDSTWEKGTWKSGQVYKSTWIDGTWESGLFEKSTWENGIWEKGNFYKSIWEKGIWENGELENSTWKKGTWKSGKFYKSTWIDGTWENGKWYIDTRNKCLDATKFNPKTIQYIFEGETYYSFSEIWDSLILLKTIKKKFETQTDIICIGNHELTIKEIKRRIKELSIK